MNTKRNFTILCGYYSKGNILRLLPPELIEKILKYADTRTTLEKLIESHLDKPWLWGEYGLSRNPAVTAKFIETHIDKPWDWGRHGLSINPSITQRFIEDNINKPWHWGSVGLSCNPAITPEFVEKHMSAVSPHSHERHGCNAVTSISAKRRFIFKQTLVVGRIWTF